jgi:uroporphyrinogen-III decarboxylase
MPWTKKERVIAALSGEIPDRTPIFDYMINDAVFEHYLGRPVIPGEQEAILRATAKCLDLCHPMPVAYEPREEILPDGTKCVFERWMKWHSYSERGDDVMLKSLKDEIERLESKNHWLFGDYIADWKAAAEKKQEWAEGMIVMQGLWLPVLPGRTIEEHAIYLADCPELCREWNQLLTRAVLQGLEKQVKANLPPPVVIIWNDIAMKGGLIYPPDVLEEYLFPGLHEMCGILRSNGIKSVFHSDGDVSRVLDELIDCGIDGFNPLEISAGMKVSDFFEKYGKKTALVGGMDAVDVLAFGTPESVAEAAKKLMREARESGGRLIIGSSSGQLDNSMPFENLMAYFNTVGEGEF